MIGVEMKGELLIGVEMKGGPVIGVEMKGGLVIGVEMKGGGGRVKRKGWGVWGDVSCKFPSGVAMICLLSLGPLSPQSAPRVGRISERDSPSDSWTHLRRAEMRMLYRKELTMAKRVSGLSEREQTTVT